MSSSYRLELNKWLSNHDVTGPTVFDVGGSQEPLKPRVKSFNVERLVTFDLENPHKESKQPDVVCDLNKKNPQIIGYKGVADRVYCLEVFDYVYDPVRALTTLKELMNHTGRLFVSFPSIYPMHQPVEDDALRYMPGGIEKLAQAVGLKVVQMTPRHFETNMWQQTISMERLRAAKRVDHSISGWIVEFKK